MLDKYNNSISNQKIIFIWNDLVLFKKSPKQVHILGAYKPSWIV